MSSHRRAAVAIHALNEADRQWVLAELPSNDRATLFQYLIELDELGFSSPGMVSMEKIVAGTSPANDSAATDVVWGASAADMFSILQAEPASLVAQVLSLREWPWASACLRTFSPTRQERIADASPSSNEEGPAKTQFIIDACATRLRQKRAEQPTVDAMPSRLSAANGLLRPFKRLVMSWTR